MGLVYKQLFRQIIKDKIFLCLLFLLTILTSLSFFFVLFSVDGNMKLLNALDRLTKNQQLYKNALTSNTYLAYHFLASLIGLSALVFVMFFYRYFRASKKQIGCLKALGFQNNRLRSFFVIFTAVLSFFGALAGLLGGYFLSEILIKANSQTYAVTNLVKAIGGFSLFSGLIVTTAVFCLTAFFCYGFVKNKEAGFLLAGNDRQSRFPITLKTADKISRLVPRDHRLSVRIALRKPLSVLLLFAAVMSFCVCIILGQSLNISSATIFNAQTKSHNYEYNVRFWEYQTAELPKDSMAYIDTSAAILIGNYELDRTITGLYQTSRLYELKNQNDEPLRIPDVNTVYINSELSEIYGVGIGDAFTAEIEGVQQTFTVADIAVNAESKSIYMNGNQLTEFLDVTPGSYNGVFSMNELRGDAITAKAQRIDDLKRNAVSNKVSGVINQAMGVLAGAILIFLALYINFQDNTRDILILNMIGHRNGCIRKMLVDVYLPILWSAFVLTLWPSIILSRSIQKSLSISTNDYMPFGLNVIVILAAFSLISLIYWGVQITFRLGVKKIILKKEITELIYSE